MELPTPNDQNNPTGDAKRLRETTPVTPESIGLTADALPAKPKDALAAAKKCDRVDAALDRQVFVVKTRRAVLLEKLKTAKVHRHFRLRWEEFVEQHFPGGYDTWSRYRAVARVQKTLHEWKMPLVTNEAQSRAIAPLLRHGNCEQKLRTILSQNGGKFPAARAISPKAAPKTNPANGGQNQTRALLWELLSSHRLLEEERAAVEAILERITRKAKAALDENLETPASLPAVQGSLVFPK